MAPKPQTVGVDEHASLLESELRFRSISDCAPTGIWVVNATGECVWLNAHWLTYTGAKLSEQVGDRWLTSIHAEDRQAIFADYKAAFDAREPFSISYRLRRNDGMYRWHVSNGNPRFGDSGEFLGYVGLVTDEHDLREARQREETLKAELVESNKDLARFASIASHDLQAPLRHIKGFSEILRSDYGDRFDEDGLYLINTLVASSDKLSSLIRDLLEFSVVDQANNPLLPVDTQNCFDQATEHLRSLIAEKQAVLTADSLPMVTGYESLITRLLQNLIGNAIKYHRSGTPEIKITCQPSGDKVQFSISDNGIGIAAENFEKIFEPFKRLHGGKEFSGSGIGLATCKRVIDRLGGRIWVESEPNVGSTFHFTLTPAP